MRSKSLFFVLLLLLILSLSFVSAGFFSDIWNKITGNTITGKAIDTGPNSGLVAYWKFDEYNESGIYDSSTYNHFGVFKGGIGVSNIKTGLRGKALEFDGVNDYISIQRFGDLDLVGGAPGATILAWVYINNDANRKFIFSDVWQFALTRLRLEVQKDEKISIGAIERENATEQIVTTNSAVSTGVWHHIAAVYDIANDNMVIYVDGSVPAQTGTPSFSQTDFGFDMDGVMSTGIGYHMGPLTYSFNGSIDEVMIFNRALTPAEILDYYNSYSESTSTCGDGSCDGGETTASCPRDCPAATYECSDSIDNDNDFLIDYGTSPTNDPGCSSSNDNNETDTIISGDTITPSTPANLSAIALSSSQVYLSWGASTDNIGIGGYKIYKNNIQVGASITTFYTDTNLQAETTYTYAVSAYDTSGNEGNKSNSVNATTQTQSLNASDTTPPARSNQQPFGSLALGTKQTIISLATDESATCKYSTTPNTDYNSMPYLFSTTGGMVHSQLIQGLSDGNSYNYYIRCNDVWGNFNTDDFSISFSVNTSSAVTSCTLTNASWSKTSATEGDTITLTVTGNNCDREQVNFEVLEDDLLSGGDSVVTPPASAVFSGNTATTSWTAEYQVDGIFGINDPPEYYSIASLNSDSNVNLNSKSNALLEVNQYLHLCLEKGGQVCLSSQTCDGTITDVNEKNQCCIGDCLNTTKSSGVYRSFSSEKVDGDEIFTVNIDVSINKNEKYYVIDETIPNNFSIINPGIGNTQKEGHITWVVIKNANSATYNYSVKAPSPTQKTTYSFNGIYLFENMSSVGTITGSRDIIVS